MDDFLERTGVVGGAPPRRYLWTDAFAVCTLLGLAREAGDKHDRELALELVDQVHHVLGRHRDDDPRSGWISGLGEAEGEEHPTAGGLRIGKELGERWPEEPFDERREWDRDGQYLHYLTKWMHALLQVARATGDEVYHRWAVELARAAHAAFTVRSQGGLRMVWKMSIDLSRPLVPSMGQHDPLDALVTYLQLTAAADGSAGLDEEIREAAAIAGEVRLPTTDPLGIGGLLGDACRLLQLEAGGDGRPELTGRVLTACGASLQAFAGDRSLRLPASGRLAFRELGLAIGLHGAERMDGLLQQLGSRRRADLRPLVHELEPQVPLAGRIEAFWRDPAARRAPTWTEHEDINAVMLATSLAPEGYLAD